MSPPKNGAAVRSVDSPSADAPQGAEQGGTAPDEGKAAEWVPIDSIHPWKDNPYGHDAEQVTDIVRSMKRFGWTEPIICRKENREIAAGHGRYLAAKRKRMTHVLVRFVDLTESEAHAYALADNEIAKGAQRDDEAMMRILHELNDDGVELDYGMGLEKRILNKLTRETTDEGSGVANSRRRTGLKYAIVIECDGEDHQAALLERFDGEGLKAKPSIT